MGLFLGGKGPWKLLFKLAGHLYFIVEKCSCYKTLLLLEALHRKGQLYFAYLTCDSSVVIKVIQCEGPFLPVIFLYRYITLQFLRNMQRAADYLKQKACLQRRLSVGGCLLSSFLPPSWGALRTCPGDASVHHSEEVPP